MIRSGSARSPAAHDRQQVAEPAVKELALESRPISTCTARRSYISHRQRKSCALSLHLPTLQSLRSSCSGPAQPGRRSDHHCASSLGHRILYLKAGGGPRSWSWCVSKYTLKVERKERGEAGCRPQAADAVLKVLKIATYIAVKGHDCRWLPEINQPASLSARVDRVRICERLRHPPYKSRTQWHE